MTSPTKRIDFAGVRMSQRMFAAWTVTRDEFEKEFPHAPKLIITKGAFQSDFHPPSPDDPSAGYHDLSGALDIRTENLSPAERNGFIRIARSIGWAAWLRDPNLPGQEDFSRHAHMALLGEPKKVDGKPYVDDGLINQIEAYKTEGGGGCCGHGGNGLTGDVSSRDDPHPRPHPIPVFDYEAWENDMQLTDKVELNAKTRDVLKKREMSVSGLLQTAARNATLAKRDAAVARQLAKEVSRQGVGLSPEAIEEIERTIEAELSDETE